MVKRTSIYRVLVVIALNCGLLAQAFAQHPKTPLGMAYELYSWQDGSEGKWNFSLLPSPSGVYIRGDAVFSKDATMRGSQELYRKIAALPAGSHIFWFDWILPNTPENMKASQRLKVPSGDLMKEIRRYAEAHHVPIEMMESKANFK